MFHRDSSEDEEEDISHKSHINVRSTDLEALYRQLEAGQALDNPVICLADEHAHPTDTCPAMEACVEQSHDQTGESDMTDEEYVAHSSTPRNMLSMGICEHEGQDCDIQWSSEEELRRRVHRMKRHFDSDSDVEFASGSDLDAQCDYDGWYTSHTHNAIDSVISDQNEIPHMEIRNSKLAYT